MNWIFIALSLLPTVLPWFGQGAQRVAQTVQAVQTAQAVQQQAFRPVVAQPAPPPQPVFHEGRWWKWENGQWWVWVPVPDQVAYGR